MNEFISMEVRFFLVSVVWGMILLIMYDCLRIFRKVVNHGAVWMSIEDIFYWTISAVLIFRMMYELNNGIIRGFSLIGILLGMVIYKYSISEYIVRGISFLIIKVKEFLKKVIHILLKPLRFLFGKLKQLLILVGKSIRKRIGLFAHFIQKEAGALWKALQSKAKRGKMSESDQRKSIVDPSEVRRSKRTEKNLQGSGRKPKKRMKKSRKERIKKDSSGTNQSKMKKTG